MFSLEFLVEEQILNGVFDQVEIFQNLFDDGYINSDNVAEVEETIAAIIDEVQATL